MNISEFVSISSAICPERPAIVFENSSCTFGQLDLRINKLANALSKLGVKNGDRIALLQVNSPQCVEVCFAAAKLGAIYLPLNFRAKENELEYMLNFAGANVLFVGERYLSLVDSIRNKLESVKHYISLDNPHPGMSQYIQVLYSGSNDDINVEVSDDDVAILMYTAGTTGNPKGVMLQHKSFSGYVLDNVSPPDADVDERNIITVPLYHVAGIQAVMSAIYGGRTIVMQRQFEAQAWMELVQKEKVSRAMMIPTMLKQLMDHPLFFFYNLSSLKVITYGAAPMPLTIIKKALDVFPNVNFINAFGQTETAATITMLGPEDHVLTGNAAEREIKLRRLASIGKPLADVEMKVVDRVGDEVPCGIIGEIVARGPRIMAGYFKDDEKTGQTIDKDRWIHTRDMGYRDADNYFFLCGRATDLIKRGGEYISPDELENVILTHPKIEDVAVIGIYDEEWGELPEAICVLKKGENCSDQEIIEYTRTRLASFKRPRLVIFVDELPRNTMGKVVKKELREKYGKKELVS